MILSIVKGSKRIRSTETILSKDGIIEMPSDSPGFVLLQQIRDESHRFAITSNRNKKNKSIKSIKSASVEDLCKVSGISIKLALEINIFYKS